MSTIVNAGVQITQLTDYTDKRGSSFAVPDSVFDYLGSVTNMHVVDLEPGGVRGNHYHVGTREVILARHDESWRLAIALPDGTGKEQCEFEGSGCVLVCVEPDIVHAICNTGNARMSLVALYQAPSDGGETQTIRVPIF